jgi:hypothetical protein
MVSWPSIRNTSSVSRAAVSAIQRVPQLGQNPLFLQENAASGSKMAGVAICPQETVVYATALEIRFEFLMDMQRPARSLAA